MRIDEMKVYPPYLCFAINGYKGLKEELERMACGAIMAGLNTKILKTSMIPLPPLEEQKRIAGILKEQMAAVEGARRSAEAQLQAAEILPAAHLRAVFNSPEAQSWPRKRFGDISEIIAKQVDPKEHEYGALPHVNGENIESGRCRLTYLNTAAQEGMISGKYLFESGDVLYSKLRPYLRKAFVADFRGVCSADMYPIRVNREHLDPHFTAWLLVSDKFTEYADEESRRARMPKLNRDQLFAWNTPLPPLADQRRIASELSTQMSSAERLRQTLAEQLDAINRLPAALLREAFSGRV
jgi:type I restriction enzyme S subunit